MKLTKKQKEQIKEIGDKHNLELIVMHGSYAKGQERLGSDLDIAVLGKKPINFNKWCEIFGDLTKVFGNNRERELDLKTLENADALFLYQVMKDSVLLYGSFFNYLQLKTYSVRNYWDHKPIFKVEDILVHKYFYKNKATYL